MYTVYESKISEVVQPKLLEISSSINAEQLQNCEQIVKDLIQLGMQLKSFASKGLELFPEKDFQVLKYDTWINEGIDRLCKVYVSKELQPK